MGIGRGVVGDCSGQGDYGDDGSDVLGIGRGAVDDCSGHGDGGDDGSDVLGGHGDGGDVYSDIVERMEQDEVWVWIFACVGN